MKLAGWVTMCDCVSVCSAVCRFDEVKRGEKRREGGKKSEYCSGGSNWMMNPRDIFKTAMMVWENDFLLLAQKRKLILFKITIFIWQNGAF